MGNRENIESVIANTFGCFSHCKCQDSAFPPPLRVAISELLQVTMLLRQLIASSCRQRILEIMSGLRETHLMDLVRRTNSTYTQVNRNLQILEREGIVRIRFYGRMKMVSLERENPKTDVILKVLKMLRNTETKGCGVG